MIPIAQYEIILPMIRITMTTARILPSVGITLILLTITTTVRTLAVTTTHFFALLLVMSFVENL
jgi:hypothetical protein